MDALTKELMLAVRWPNGSRDSSVLFPQGTGIPCAMEVVAGRQEVHAGGLYEVELSSGDRQVLQVSGAIPAPKDSTEIKAPVSADAWIRCGVEKNNDFFYEIHLGPAGMGQPKAYHKGRIPVS